LGHHWIAIPNPTYGSWKAAAYSKDFKFPLEGKIDALKTCDGRSSQ